MGPCGDECLTSPLKAENQLAMSVVEELEQAVIRLSAADLAAFRAWFDAFQAAQWEAEIEMDIRNGRLDALADEAVGEYRSGAAKRL